MPNTLATRIAPLVTLAVVALSGNFAQAQSPTIKYRFGMNVKLQQYGFQKGLYIRTVVPGGPACRAGLKPGMLIVSSNNKKFENAFNDFHGVSLLQNSVQLANGGGGGGGGGIDTFQQTTPQPFYFTRLVVKLPCGRIKHITCYPTPRYPVGGGGVDTF